MVSEKLRILRNKKGLTQKEIAATLGLSRERYNQYETGKRRPDYETLANLSHFFQ